MQQGEQEDKHQKNNNLLDTSAVEAGAGGVRRASGVVFEETRRLSAQIAQEGTELGGDVYGAVGDLFGFVEEDEEYE